MHYYPGHVGDRNALGAQCLELTKTNVHRW